jgi:periplasmic divalent cation tolerance protein
MNANDGTGHVAVGGDTAVGGPTGSDVTVVLTTVGDAAQAERIARLRALHPYDMPEMLALPVADGWPAYLDWVRTQIR